MRRLRGDVGALAPAVPVFAFILLLLGGLVVDASRLLNARGRAIAYAEEAARAGASAIRAGQAGVQLDEAVVRARVQGYCDAILADPAQRGGVLECAYRPPLRRVGDGDPRELVVVVFVRLEIPASLLGIVGVQTLGASGEGRARPYEGVDDLDVDSSPPPVDVAVPDAPPDAPPGVEVPFDPVPTLPPVPTPLPTDLPTETPSPAPTSPVEPAPSPTTAPVPEPTGAVPPPEEPAP